MQMRLTHKKILPQLEHPFAMTLQNLNIFEGVFTIKALKFRPLVCNPKPLIA